MDKIDTLLLKGLKEKEEQLEKELRDIKDRIKDIEIPNCEHNMLLRNPIVKVWKCRSCGLNFTIEKYLND